MSVEEPAAKSEQSASAPAPGPAPERPHQGAMPIIIGAAVVVVLLLGGYIFSQNRSLFPSSHGPLRYEVQAFSPPAPLITAGDHIIAHVDPDAGSAQVVIFGQGVGLQVNGRVSRGFGDDWYAIVWNGQRAFVQARDTTTGQAVAPPQTAPRVPPLPPREPVKPEDDAAEDPDFPTVSNSFELTNPRWINRPGARDVARYYPRQALDRGQSGRVTLDCEARASGALDCSVANEDPGGYGFGDAALRISRGMRVASTTSDGRSVEGGHVRVPLTFRAD